MYTKFFGFKEKPFMLAPNPAYLFLGKSHEEAMAHLVYAVGEGEGFISLIGKRGVGKTTVCQALIDRQEATTAVAYIFKPEVSSEELIKKINSEFNITSDTDDIKELNDSLNTFLMQQRVDGKNVVLFIDDAQDLTADALEQVRLLSNLETTRDKLLQIVLVGEPELADMLASQALRQLGQRVSVSYHINPLTYEETCAYIYHRMSVASRGAQTHFESAALKRIYKFSDGIPRMINIACDQSLATAHRLHHRHISGEITKTAILSLAGTQRYQKSDSRRFALRYPRRAMMFAAVCCLLLLLAVVAFFPRQAERREVALKPAAEQALTVQPERTQATRQPAPVQRPVQKENTPSVLEFSETEEPAVESDRPAFSSPVKDVPSEPSVKMTHSVQVGAFRSRVQARKLVGILKRKNYPAGIISVIDPKNRIWFTVRIGDFPSRAAALRQADEFTAREKMESAVRPFEKL
jgi:general secretion pathway protein A